MKFAPAFLLLAPLAALAATDRAAIAGRLPLRFEQNTGQHPAAVRFHARSAAYQLFLTERETVVATRQGSVRFSLAGSNPHPALEGEQPFQARATYLTGRDRSQWRDGVAQYAKVCYRGVYPGIDAVYYGNQRDIEHDFIVAPGADPAAIRLHFEGAAPTLDASGDLVLTTPAGEQLRQHKPVAYQDGREVAVRFVLSGNEARFALGAYDPTKDLVIDPVLSYATLLGGGDTDIVRAITIDPQGFVWIAGSTISQNFPLAGQSTRTESAGATDIFVAKLNLNASGNESLLYTTYIGGSGNEEAHAIAFRNGNLYLAGVTYSADLPALGTTAQKELKGEGDAFVIYLNTTVPGTEALWYSTFLGGSNTDIAEAMVVTGDNNVYVAGTTRSQDFPTFGNPVQPTSRGGQEAFFFLLNPNPPQGGQALVYSTYFGGSSADSGRGIAVDAAGFVYLAGSTSSADFPISSGIQDRDRRSDGFIAKIDLTKQGLAGLTYAGYVGGTGVDVGTAIALNARLGACVGGYTLSDDFPVSPSAPQTQRAGAADAFVSCFDLSIPGFATMTYSTLLGGNQDDVLYALVSDAQNRLYATGYAISTNFPLRNAVQNTNRGFMDVFVTRLDPEESAANGIGFSTLYGGELADIGYGLALDASGQVLVAGTTISRVTAVTASAAQSTPAGRGDSYIARFDLSR